MITEQRVLAATDPVLQRCLDSGFESLSTPEKIVLAVWLLDAEVCHGGFAQYFSNSSGQHAAFTTFALQAIGAKRIRVLLDSAIDIIGGIPPREQVQRKAIIEELTDYARELLDRLDSEFYEEPDNLNKLLLTFIARESI